MKKRLSCLFPYIWNSLSNQAKKGTDYTMFREFIGDSFGMKCKCNLCTFLDIGTRMSTLFDTFDTFSICHILVGNGFALFFILVSFFIIFVCY